MIFTTNDRLTFQEQINMLIDQLNMLFDENKMEGIIYYGPDQVMPDDYQIQIMDKDDPEPEPDTYTTTLFGDGTFIIQEPASKREENITEHGSVVAEFDPLDWEHNYNFVDPSERPWDNYTDSIYSVKIGSEIHPGITKYWFANFSNCTEVDLHNLKGDGWHEASGMFMGCTSLESIDLSVVDITHLEIASAMFADCMNLTEISIPPTTSALRFTDSMFYGCSSLTSLDVSNMNTSQVVSTYQMFYGCSGLTSLDVSNFSTSNVENMGRMFSGCTSLTILDLSGFDTAQVSDFWRMFDGCTALRTLDISGFDSTQLHNVPNPYQSDALVRMFEGCTNLITIYATPAFGVQNVLVQSNNMFLNCYSLVGGAGTTYSSSYTDKRRAKIDGGPGDEGYFTAKT